MSRVVVDTDIASYIFNWHSSAQQFTDPLHGYDPTLSFMSVAELRMGAISARWGLRRRTLLESYIGAFEVIHSNDDLCAIWAHVRATARAAGRSVSPQDAWIAATALSLDCPLATNNRRDFEHIPQLRLLSS